MRLYLLISILLLKTLSFAQVTEDFSDGDFTANPTWSGSQSEFIINSSKQLQLNSTTQISSNLSLPHNLTSIDGKEWRFYLKQSFAGSASNYGRIFLTSDNQVISTNQTGYFLQFGEANGLDAIRLNKMYNGSITEICAGPPSQITNGVNASIRVKRAANGDWSLYADFAGGDNYTLLATANDPSNYIGTYFGVSCVYTSSNATKFFYDNIYIGNEIFDVAPPILNSANVISANQVDVLFNEAITTLSSELTTNYALTPALSLSSATLDATNPALVHLVYASNFTNGTNYTLSANNISDLAGNIAGNQTTPFGYFVADSVVKGDVIISEFYADPSPSFGLPEVEFIEIYNKSTKIFNLQGWKIGDASGDGTIGTSWILPGEYKVLCATSSVELFTTTSAVATSSFPSLNNSGDDVVLKDNYGIVLDKLSYTDDWYQDENKKDGGFTLELINPNDPCSDENNWIASTDFLGGTPGQVNSVFNITPDNENPQVTYLLAMSPNWLEIHFNEGMDSTSLVNATMTFNPNLTIQSRQIIGAFPNQLTVQFNENLVGSQTYNLNLQNVSDCWLNSSDYLGQFILPEMPAVGDLVVNEILQNPLNGGSDWIELYNNSTKVINLKDWQLANFDNDTIDNFKTISDNYLLLPNDYVVVGKDSTFVKEHYPFSVSGKFLYSELPSYNNDSGTVYLIYNSEIIDKVSYLDSWHFKLLDNTDGVSLERIDPNGASSNGFNWHSAAEDVKFATPGRINSQYLPAVSNGTLNFTSEVISPDNDGFEDVMQANYELTENGLLGKATIYDDRGRVIRELFKSELLGSKGSFSWDGTTDSQVKASIGVYVLVFEAFSTNGGVFFTKKLAVTVAGKL